MMSSAPMASVAGVRRPQPRVATSSCHPAAIDGAGKAPKWSSASKRREVHGANREFSIQWFDFFCWSAGLIDCAWIRPLAIVGSAAERGGCLRCDAPEPQLAVLHTIT